MGKKSNKFLLSKPFFSSSVAESLDRIWNKLILNKLIRKKF